MNKIIYLSLLLLSMSSCGSAERYNAQILEKHSVPELHEDIDKTYIRLKRAHPKLYQYISKEQLDYKFDSLKRAITAPLSSKEFYYSIAPVVKTIGQGHIGLSPPKLKRTKEERKAYKDKKFSFNTLEFENVENRLFVTSAKEADSILIGSEVLEFDGESPQELIKRYNKNIASDGFNVTLFDRFVASRFTRYYSLDKGFLDSITLKFKQRDSVFFKQFKWKDKKKKNDSLSDFQKDSIAAIRPIKLSKAQRKFKRDSLKNDRKYKQTHGYNFTTHKYNRNLSFIGNDSTVALMKISGFTNGDFRTFYEETFNTLDSLQTKDLIIDLRDNTGGRVKEINDLYGYLTDKEYVMYNEAEVTGRTPIIKTYMSNSNPFIIKALTVLASPGILVHNLIKTRKHDGKIYYRLNGVKPLEPKEKNFKGAIYVLINGSSFSASSLLSTNLKKDNRAVFVGQETGGAHNGTVAGMTRGYVMPNSKVKIGMGVMQVESPYKIEPDGYGVMPDVEIIPTVADRKMGIDPEIEWVLNDIKKKE
ncbi:peptidase S41 [Patiriisocius marinistellae]|uniref:Peptidase S41 n=1 Tax=Patiriisocius marinistellae TaxID=2494560 RepID=A0A5J4G218_9FLAO|nr:S41 family peptidase [Patiriisocius marinistellae]GEQ86141.1 peptidase S41 [Patiriisocius marinistellae]